MAQSRLGGEEEGYRCGGNEIGDNPALARTLVQRPRQAASGTGWLLLFAVGLMAGMLGALLLLSQQLAGISRAETPAVEVAPAPAAVTAPVPGPLDLLATEFSADEESVQCAEQSHSACSAPIALQGPQLLTTYQDRDRGIEAGALYAFHVHGNPELLLCLEQYAGGEVQFELSRMTSMDLFVSFRGTLLSSMDHSAGTISYCGGMVNAYHAQLWSHSAYTAASPTLTALSKRTTHH